LRAFGPAEGTGESNVAQRLAGVEPAQKRLARRAGSVVFWPRLRIPEPIGARRIQEASPNPGPGPPSFEDPVKCSDVINSISDYLDAEAAQDLCAQLEAHLADCPQCRIQIDTVKKTISLYRSESSLECPEQVRTRLHTVLSFEYRKK
jgi:anti-sigma factor (TIGR02949 family)